MQIVMQVSKKGKSTAREDTAQHGCRADVTWNLWNIPLIIFHSIPCQHPGGIFQYSNVINDIHIINHALSNPTTNKVLAIVKISLLCA